MVAEGNIRFRLTLARQSLNVMFVLQPLVVKIFICN